jgi:WD40 repeat protein
MHGRVHATSLNHLTDRIRSTHSDHCLTVVTPQANINDHTATSLPMMRLTAFGLIAITATVEAHAQGGTDIFVATLQQSGRSVTITAPVNVTKRAGYDNQPSFTPDGKSLLYTSIGADGQASTWSIPLRDGASTRLTNTAIGIYSPTVTPDGKSFSVIRVELDSTQRLWKFPLNGGEPTLVLDSIKPVGYHAWLNPGTLALFVLGNPPTLQIADVATGKATTVASNIGRALVKVPHHDAVNFVQVVPDSGQWLAEYDLAKKSVRRLGKLPDNADYVVWTPRGALLTAAGSKIYRWNDGVWTEAADFAGLGIRGISRLAVNPAGDQLAFVAEDP